MSPIYLPLNHAEKCKAQSRGTSHKEFREVRLNRAPLSYRRSKCNSHTSTWGLKHDLRWKRDSAGAGSKPLSRHGTDGKVGIDIAIKDYLWTFGELVELTLV